MVWEQRSSAIVMMTRLEERNRVDLHFFASFLSYPLATRWWLKAAFHYSSQVQTSVENLVAGRSKACRKPAANLLKTGWSKACRKPTRTCQKPGCKPGRKPGLQPSLQLARIMECGHYWLYVLQLEQFHLRCYSAQVRSTLVAAVRFFRNFLAKHACLSEAK